MRIAIVGSGIAGNVAAYRLRDRFDITVFEANDYVGGHTNTIDVEEDGRTIPVDTGFIVFNERTYPNFIRILEEIGQASTLSEMSFSVHAEDDRFEYSGSSLNGLIAQRSSVLKPSFYRLVRDILRFNRSAVAEIGAETAELTIGDYLCTRAYSSEFTQRYLLPMIAAIWSAEPGAVLDMPAIFLIRFFHNHGLLQLRDRPKWRVIEGGSREYVAKLTAGHWDRIRLRSPVRSLRRTADGVEVTSDSGGREWFDYAFLACHSDQALALLADATPAEREVLGAIRYQRNEAVLHTDTRVLPRRRRAWSSWNYFVPCEPNRAVTVSYNMNILQTLRAKQTYCVTLNDDSRIDADKVIRRIAYDHPVYTLETIAAQQRQAEINCGQTYFCGAYWRNGFHEDGVVSALNAVRDFEENLRHAECNLRRVG